MTDVPNQTARRRFSSELVMRPIVGDHTDNDVDAECMRHSLWTAIMRLGGRMVITETDWHKFLTGPYDATLHWDVDPVSGDTTLVANRGEPVFVEELHAD